MRQLIKAELHQSARSECYRRKAEHGGIPAALRVALVSHLLTIVALFALWHFAELGVVFLIGISAVSLLLLYEHWLVRPTDLSRVNLAFFHVNAVVSLGLLAIGMADLWWR